MILRRGWGRPLVNTEAPLVLMALSNSERQQRRRQRRVKEALEMLGGKCVVCGVNENLEFDHIDPATKLFEVLGQKWSVAKEVWLAEVRKCQLLCRECHKIKTYKPQRDARKHGTSAMYCRGKCRCEECRAHMREYAREYRSRRAGRSSNG